MSRPPSDPSPGRRPEGSPGDGRPPSPNPSGSSSGWIRYLPWVLVLLLVAVFFIPGLSGSSSDSNKLKYSEFLNAVEGGQVKSIEYNKSNGDIKGDYRGTVDGTDTFTADGPNDNLPDSTLDLLDEQNVSLEYTSDRPNVLLDSILPLMLPVLILVGLFVWMMRRGSSQATGLMSIGRSRAKVYSTE